MWNWKTACPNLTKDGENVEFWLVRFWIDTIKLNLYKCKGRCGVDYTSNKIDYVHENSAIKANTKSISTGYLFRRI